MDQALQQSKFCSHCSFFYVKRLSCMTSTNETIQRPSSNQRKWGKK